MSERKFKFVSPGIFIDEIDNSQVPSPAQRVGPVIIGRTERGPGMRPTRVNSMSEFINVFGNPIPGGRGGDVWRNGNFTSPTYAAYAAHAYLRNNGPVTVVRLLGEKHLDGEGGNGTPGWTTTNTAPNAGVSSNGGAFGMFIVPSASSNITAATYASGTLAAVWYINSGSIELSGTLYDVDAPAESAGTTDTSGSNALIKAQNDTSYEFKAVLRDKTGAIALTTNFNFDDTSNKFIRKVFNTNPTLTDSINGLRTAPQEYWLGESYEDWLDEFFVTKKGYDADDVDYYAAILPIHSSSTYRGNDFKMASKPAKSPWVFSQDITTNSGSYNPTGSDGTAATPVGVQKLFRFVALNSGEWEAQNLKISIQDIRKSTNPNNPYGTFTVVLRKRADLDNAVQFVERFSNCSLNPGSPDYVAKKIGDMRLDWDTSERRYRMKGNYPNMSRYIRMEMNTQVDVGETDERYIPFGFYGPPRFNTVQWKFTDVDQNGAGTVELTTADAMMSGGTDMFAGRAPFVDIGGSSTDLFAAGDGFYMNVLFPQMRLRSTSTEGNMSDPRKAYFGVQTNIKNSTRTSKEYIDLVRAKPSVFDSYDAGGDGSDYLEYSFVFTLDDLCLTGAVGTSTNALHRNAIHKEGSRVGQSGDGALSTTVPNISVSGSWEDVLEKGYDKFTLPLIGGFDGVDITKMDPFAHDNTLLSSTSTETDSYVFNSYKRAIDSISDPEVVEGNLLVVPGLKNQNLQQHMIKVCEDRADMLAILDPPEGYKPPAEYPGGQVSTTGVTDLVSTMTTRAYDSSYACMYYPWVQIRDTINGDTLWAPPSVPMLGVMGSTETFHELWFAPAGFTRGGLTAGAAGVPVTSVRERLATRDRDKLYLANVNPIASFPAEGIVAFGQKTLQVTPSALDRINVRRLMNFVKKRVSRMAATILFDQNVGATWNRFLSRVNPFLSNVQARFGLSDYRVILDETTTTPDLVDRNIMYAKIFLKPAKAIEFIAIDFVITNEGAAFED